MVEESWLVDPTGHDINLYQAFSPCSLKEVEEMRAFNSNSENMIASHDKCNFNQTILVKSKQPSPDDEDAEYDTYIPDEPNHDSRQPVKDTTTSPHSTQGRVTAYYDTFESLGSGTLISNRHVLTSAHILYDSARNMKPHKVIFIPGLNGDQKPFGEIRANRCFIPDRYEEQINEDYGVVELQEGIEKAGNMEIKFLRAEELKELRVSLYGYPHRINEVMNFRLYGTSGIVRLNRQNMLEYEIDASPGQSGSAIYSYSPEDGKYYIIGVHVRGYDHHNEGTHISSERLVQIQKWMDNKVFQTKHNLLGFTSEFYCRDSELFMMRSIMRPDKGHNVMALFGVAGIGKTTMALKFATESIGSYDYIWWIDAKNKKTFIESVLPLADILGTTGADDQETVSITRAYINSTNLSFLIIFDNLQDERLAKDFIMTRSHFIITTQLGNIEFEKIKVGSLSSKASVKLLSSKLTNRTDEELESLANFLQGHPLALYQAANYFSNPRTKVDDYKQNFSKVIGRDPQLSNIVRDNSIKYLREESQHILKIICLGSCDNIPYDTIYQVFQYKYPNTSQEEFECFLEEIARFSILSYDTTKGTFKLYRVIQEAVILKLFSSIDDSLIEDYSEYLYNHYNPQSDTYSQEKVDYLKNLKLQAIIFQNQHESTSLSTRDILNYSRLAFSYFYFLNDDIYTIKYLQIVEQSLENQITDDLDLAKVYNVLGLLYSSKRDYVRSESYYLKCLAFSDTVLAENEQIVAKTYKGLGDLYLSKGDFTRSEEHYFRCLRIRESILPSNHPDLAQIYGSLNNLYLKMKDAYDLKGADYYFKYLRIMENIEPCNLLKFAQDYIKLGDYFISHREYTRSENCYLRCKDIRETTLVQNHPDLAEIYIKLGVFYHSKKDYNRSEEYNLKYLGIWESILDRYHPELAKVYSDISNFYHSIQRYREAYYYYQKSRLNIL